MAKQPGEEKLIGKNLGRTRKMGALANKKVPQDADLLDKKGLQLIKSGGSMAKFSAEQMNQLSDLIETKLDAKIAPVFTAIDELKRSNETLTKAILGDIVNPNNIGLNGEIKVLETKQEALATKESVKDIGKELDSKISYTNGLIKGFGGITLLFTLLGLILGYLNYFKNQPSSLEIIKQPVVQKSEEK